MSYGDADRTARTSEPTPSTAPAPPLDPALWSRPDLEPLLATHDLGALFRLLSELGIGQRRIAELIGRSQSRVSEIAHGRPVLAYEVLVAIAHGLGIPPERMGLSWWSPDGCWHGPEGTYPGEVTVTDTPEGVSAAMLRRHLIAWGGITMAGVPVDKVGELLDDLGELPPVPLPSQLSHLDVVKVDRGQLDAAEQFAAASVRRWEGVSQRARIRSSIVLSTIQVRAGDPRGLQLAHSAITDVINLSSVRVRRQLAPLAEALEARPGSDARELARTARQIAA